MLDAERLSGLRDALAGAGLQLLAETRPDGTAEYLVGGDTYPHRELVRSLGARWDGRRGRWVFVAPPRPAPGLAEQAAPAFGPGLERLERAPAPWGTKHYHGHRERLRQRFSEVAPDALADYELLELLLFFSVYRRDTKPIAKDLLERFGGLAGVLAAEPARVAECPGFATFRNGDQVHAERRTEDLRFTQVLLKAVQEIIVRALKEPVRAGVPISSWTQLTDYLQAAMAHDPTEQFRVLFLDRKNQLIRDEKQSRGTVDHTPLYPREVAKRALELSASAIIMVHNHPSGDPTPSKPDIEMTRAVIDALAPLGVTVHDHVIIGRNRHLSFRAQKLI